MRVAEEILRVQQLSGEVERVVLQEDGAQDALFRFQVVGERPIRCGGGGEAGHGTTGPDVRRLP